MSEMWKKKLKNEAWKLYVKAFHKYQLAGKRPRKKIQTFYQPFHKKSYVRMLWTEYVH